MTTSEIDQGAFEGADLLPKLTDDIDKMYFLAVLSMYESFRAGAIDKKAATARKKQLQQLHDRDNLIRQIYRQHQAIERAFGGYRRELETCGCRHCQKMLRLIDGREILTASTETAQI